MWLVSFECKMAPFPNGFFPRRIHEMSPTDWEPLVCQVNIFVLAGWRHLRNIPIWKYAAYPAIFPSKGISALHRNYTTLKPAKTSQLNVAILCFGLSFFSSRHERIRFWGIVSLYSKPSSTQVFLPPLSCCGHWFISSSQQAVICCRLKVCD